MTPQLLAELLTDGAHPSGFLVSGGLPRGAKPVAADFDQYGNPRIYFEHSSFETGVGELRPVITVAP
jgi:hypothetical protein